jgi:hypothetical protein
VRTWAALSQDRDFRDEMWSPGEAQRGRGDYLFQVPRPSDGYVAVFAEAEFGRGRSVYSLSTNVAIIAGPAIIDAVPRAIGRTDVCESASPALGAVQERRAGGRSADQRSSGQPLDQVQ